MEVRKRSVFVETYEKGGNLLLCYAALFVQDNADNWNFFQRINNR